ncbi:MAG: hypothetical protein IEMM0008_0557 [bacterium]|nr:MAG: hypothetical protein IEMM0008_0557 [bacterium]
MKGILVEYQVIFSLLAGMIGTFIVLFLFLKYLKGWIINKTPFREAILPLFDIRDYGNLVQESSIKLNSQKNKIKECLQNAIGKDEGEMIETVTELYNELDAIMSEHQEKRRVLEEKLFVERAITK